jgi:hypothetical protein
MTTYNFPNHYKGDTFRAKQISLGFDITGATIKMQFKQQGANAVAFEWLTSDNTIEVINATLGIIRMKTRILDFNTVSYFYDFQITTSNGDVTTYFNGSMKILQDISK